MIIDILTSSSKSQLHTCVTRGPCQCHWHKLRIGDACVLGLSLIFYTVDYIANILLCISYFADGQQYPGAVSCALIIIPTVIIQVLSARWYAEDGNVWHLETCCCRLFICQPFERYIQALVFWFKYRNQNLEHTQLNEFVNLKNDVYMLRFLQVMVQSAPHMTYQVYLLYAQNKSAIFTGSPACVSLFALGWAVAALASVRYGQSSKREQRLVCLGLVLQMFWWMFVVLSRAVAFVAIASVLGIWVFGVVGVHWLAMTTWILLQKSEMCPSRIEKLLFASVVGVVYCYNFINLGEGRARYRLLAFYSLTLLENVAMMLSWYFVNSADFPMSIRITIVCTSLGLFLIGVTCMLVYYRFCHPSKYVSIDTAHGADCQLSPGCSPQTMHTTCVPHCVDLMPQRTLKHRRSPTATQHLELYTPSRLSPVLRVIGDTTPGDVTQLDTSCTNTLNLDRFHHYSINASDCLTPSLTVRRHGDAAPNAAAVSGSRPFDVIVGLPERDLQMFQGECVCTGQFCSVEHGGTCSTMKLHGENGRRYCDLCRLKAVRALVSSPLLSEVCESETCSPDASLLIDDRWEISLSEQLGGELSELHSGLPIGVFGCDVHGDGESRPISDHKQCVSASESLNERAKKICDSGRGTDSSSSGAGDQCDQRMLQVQHLTYLGN